MYVLDNRPAKKIMHGGRDMFNKVKINDGLKLTKKDNKEESKLKIGNVPEKMILNSILDQMTLLLNLKIEISQ